jgi:hypothetical protein
VTQQTRAQQLLQAAEVNKTLWSKWEQNFVASVEHKVAGGGELSEKQLGVLFRLATQFTSEDYETKKKLLFIMKSKEKVVPYAQKILKSMYKRELGHFSEKQKALVDRNYDIIKSRVKIK